MSKQRNKPAPSQENQIQPYFVPVSSTSAMITRSMQHRLQYGAGFVTGPPTMSMAAFTPQHSPTLEQALIKSIEVMSSQSALLAPMAQQAMEMNQSIIKMHEDNQQERRRIEEEHRAERRKSDEEHTQRMQKIMDQFKNFADAIQDIRQLVHSSGDTKEATSSNFKSPKTVERQTVSISKTAKRTGTPVSPKIRKEASGKPEAIPSSSTSNRTERGLIIVNKEVIGKGEIYDPVNKKYINFKCTACSQIFYSPIRLQEHFRDRHEEAEEPKRKMAKKQ